MTYNPPQLNLGPRYEFERVLGRGGMGVVLRAHDTLLKRPVAIKILSDELAGMPEAERVFLSESQALATLNHPNLVGIYDVVQIEGRAMMVFEFVEGITLDRMFRKADMLPEADLVVLVDRCLAKTPAERPESVTAVREFLGQISADIAAGKRPSKPRLSAPQRVAHNGHTTVVPPRQDNALWVALGVVTGLVVVAAVAVLVVFDLVTMPTATSKPVVQPSAVLAPPVPSKPVAPSQKTPEPALEPALGEARSEVLQAQILAQTNLPQPAPPALEQPSVARRTEKADQEGQPTEPPAVPVEEYEEEPQPVEPQAFKPAAQKFQPAKFGRTPGISATPDAVPSPSKKSEAVVKEKAPDKKSEADPAIPRSF